MARESNTLVLKNGFGDLSAPASFVVGIPAVVDSTSQLNFRVYFKRFLTRIRALPKSKLDPSHMLENAYEAVFHGSKDFSSSGIKDGFLYPTKHRSPYTYTDGLYNVKESLLGAARTKTLISIGYRSARRGFSGEPLLVTRPYVGRVEKLSSDGRSFQLKIGEDYRTFRIDELKWFHKFTNQYADGVMRHIHMTFSPVDAGKVAMQWQLIDGENSPLLTEPWHDPLQPDERQQLKEPSTSESGPSEDEILEAILVASNEQELEEAELTRTDLKEHYGEYVRIDVLSREKAVVEEIHMRLMAVRFDPQSDYIRLIGEAGIELYDAVKNFKFYDLAEL